MAITSIKTGSSFTNLTKYDSFLAGNPSYVPPSFESIQTITPSGASNIEFTSIPSSYVSLQIRFNFIASTAGGTPTMTFNADTGANYTQHLLGGDGAASVVYGAASTSNMWLGFYNYGVVTTYPNVGIIDIHNYQNTSQYKTMRAFTGNNKNTANSDVYLASGLWRSTSAITSIKISTGSGNFNSGSTFALYGIKGA